MGTTVTLGGEVFCVVCESDYQSILAETRVLLHKKHTVNLLRWSTNGKVVSNRLF